MKSRMLSLTGENTHLVKGKAVLIWLLTSLLLAWTFTASLPAQNYQSLPIHEDYIYPNPEDFATSKEYRDAARVVKSRHSDARSAVADAVKADSSNFGPDGDKYMLQYRLAAMTQTSDRYLSRLGSMRTEFLKLYMDRSSPAVRRSVIGKILPELEKIALDDQFHPAVRVNAVTLIGLLDEQDGDSSNPPVPSGAAYQSLKKIWSSGGAPAVRAGAISGIRRFAEISRRGTSDQSMVGDFKPELLAILAGSAAGQDQWEADFDYWMKRRATQTLGYIGEGNDVIDAVTKVMTTKPDAGKRDTFWLRFDGLEALANTRFAQLDRGKVAPLIDDVLGYVAETLDLEADRLQAEVDDLVYTNILWGDYDLKDPRARRPRGPSGAGRGGGGGGRNDRDDSGGISGLGGGGDGGGSAGLDDGGRGGGPPKGGPPPGGGRGGFPGGGRGGARGGLNLENRPHRVELPVFMMNNSRARLKAVLVTALRFMDEPRFDRGIVTIADADTKKRITDEIVPLLNELIEETEVGVIDHKAKSSQLFDTEEVDVTHAMIELCRKKAEALRKKMTNPPKQEEVAAPGGSEGPNQ